MGILPNCKHFLPLSAHCSYNGEPFISRKIKITKEKAAIDPRIGREASHGMWAIEEAKWVKECPLRDKDDVLASSASVE